ncbi:translocase [Litorisediminicola beolgyonensis]|uniref:Translocase n=1 Tax=Litorisediminicola beolgyonensis TaxID=1173614 RepID=A0ABW3ZCI1_9RHOB
MLRSKSIRYVSGTLFCALAIGYVMQFGFSLPTEQAARGPLPVSDVHDTSAMLVATTGALPVALLPGRDSAMTSDLCALGMPVDPAAPRLPDASVSADLPAPLPPAPTDLPSAPDLRLAALDGGTDFPSPIPAIPQAAPAPAPGETAVPQQDCSTGLTADTGAAAMVTLKIDAACHASEAFTLHHNGLMIDGRTDATGSAQLDIPAISTKAVFVLSFADGDGAVAQTEVSSLDFYDRIALQWEGPAGLQLHALEYGAAPFSDGHIWQETPGTLAAASRGEGGFLVTLGPDHTAPARRVQVYSFPAGTAARAGHVAVSVEAEVTAANCDSDLEAQVLDLRGGGRPTMRELTVAMPGCDAAGDILVLKNLLEDLTVAAR